MAKEKISREQQNEIESFVVKIIRMIKAGDEAVPDELIEWYKILGPKDFGTWLHGYCCGRAKQKVLSSSEIFEFLKRQMQ